MGLFGLEEKKLKLIIFGGKGGVGKTTCASSTGIHLSDKFKTLMLSTDPAHSLADSLGQKTADEIKEVTGIGKLNVLEINVEKAFAKFKAQYETEIKRIFDTSTYLDNEDVDSVFALPIPGLDEVMGLKTIVDLIDAGQHEKYIVDTAPTGHALRLLDLPNLLDEWIKVLAKMRWKYRYMIESFSGKYTPDDGDNFLLNLKKTVKKIESLLKDPARCEFVAVTIPENMAILETERLIKAINSYGIKINQLIINNVVEPGNCSFCRERRKNQEKYINQIKKTFDNLRIVLIPLQPHDVKGLDALYRIKEILFQ